MKLVEMEKKVDLIRKYYLGITQSQTRMDVELGVIIHNLEDVLKTVRGREQDKMNSIDHSRVQYMIK